MGHASMETGVYQSEPTLCSYPPRVHEHGEDSAYITLKPWGDDTDSGVTLFLEVDEAENLARKLLEVALAAKGGVFTAMDDE